MKEKRARPVGAAIFAGILGWLGIAGLLNAVAWPLTHSSNLMQSASAEFVARFPPVFGSIWLSIFALAYGISALVTATAIWRLSPMASKSYLAWVVTVVTVTVVLSFGSHSVPHVATAIFLTALLVLLAAGWLYTHRLVQP